jgi:hypothetical protein
VVASRALIFRVLTFGHEIVLDVEASRTSVAVIAGA